jgi:DNA-binding Lrp family transcriptional regulator
MVPTRPKEHRPPGPPPRARPGEVLDEVDLAILAELVRDGRQPNNALAATVGVAPSTCLVRTRALRERGVLRGIHADVDLAALGRPVLAMVAVRLAAHTRAAIDRFRSAAPRLPGVVAVYHVSGATDYVLHVAVPDTAALRDFVLDHVTSNPAVAHAETSLIFEHVRGDRLPGLES